MTAIGVLADSTHTTLRSPMIRWLLRVSYLANRMVAKRAGAYRNVPYLPPHLHHPRITTLHLIRRHETPFADPTVFAPGSLDCQELLTDPDLVEAFLALPLRWRLVLWEMDIQDQPPRLAAPRFNLTPNALSALHRRQSQD
jgi:hypothetical protein